MEFTRYLLLLLVFSAPSQASIIFEQNWEDGKIGDADEGFRPVQYCCDHSINIVTKHANEGRRSLHSQVLQGDSSIDGHTSRAISGVLPGATINGKAVLPYDTDRWFGFAIYIPSNADIKLMYLFDAHVQNWGSPQCALGISSPLVLRLEGPGYKWGDGNYYWKLTTYPDNTNGANGSSLAKFSANADVDNWTHFVIHMKWTYGEDGIIKVWKNGVMQYSNTNFTLSSLPIPQSCGPLYPKIGVGNSGDAFYPMEAFHDSIRWGDENSSYEEVAPANAPSPSPPPPPAINPSPSPPFILLLSSHLNIPKVPRQDNQVK